MVQTCPTEATTVGQSSYWSPKSLNWDAHRIGWAISGGCTVLTIIITIFSVLSHCRNYSNRAEQRQIIRILYMPPVYAITSFFSYLYFRSYTYYELIEAVYESVMLSAFMLLIIEYVASTAVSHDLCCWRYRPTKAYFMYTMKWIVIQYSFVRPLLSIVGIICQALNILCENEGLIHFEFAYVYITIANLISNTVSCYGLSMFSSLTKDELVGKRPLAKFRCISFALKLTLYQSIIFHLLEGRVIKATEYWTEANIADGLAALATCIEMVLFAVAMMWAYPPSSYKIPGVHTSIWRPIFDSINFTDFAIEIWGSLKFFFDYMLGKPETRSPRGKKLGFAEAFGIEGATPLYDQATSSGYIRRGSTVSNFGAGNMAGVGVGVRSYDCSEAGMGVGASNMAGVGAGVPSYDYTESGMVVGAGSEGHNYNSSLTNGGNHGGQDGN